MGRFRIGFSPLSFVKRKIWGFHSTSCEAVTANLECGGEGTEILPTRHPGWWGRGALWKDNLSSPRLCPGLSVMPTSGCSCGILGWLGLGDCGEHSQPCCLQPARVGPGVRSRLWQPLHSGFLFQVPGRRASRRHPAHVPTRLRAWHGRRLCSCWSLNTFTGLLLG